MYYDRLYKELLSRVTENLLDRWPEAAFSCAGWKELTEHSKAAYKTLAARKYLFPHTARFGQLIVPGSEKLLPYLWNWSSYRGIILCPPKDADRSENHLAFIGRIAGSFAFRIFAQDTKKVISFHKVDIEKMGENLKVLPNSPGGSVIVTREGIHNLTNLLKEQIANNPIDAFQWRCDADAGNYAKSIHVVLVANWSDLNPTNNSGPSEEQRDIMKLMQTSVAAQNGIYFILCSDTWLELDGVPQAVIMKPSSAQGRLCLPTPDKGGKTGTSDTKVIPLSFSLPTRQQVIELQDAQKEFESGTIEDDAVGGIWKANSTQGLRCIIGVTPKRKPQYFELGMGRGEQAYHALVGGATGSGKSVLLNEMICSLAERYSPEELRFVLLDYKEGTEFAPYQHLPHVLALSIGPNPEFGLEALKWISRVTEDRGNLFKEADVNNITGYRTKTGKKMCRYLVIADEFQVLCSDRKYGEEAKKLFNDLARRGRSFGIHLILSTQTLRDGSLDGEAKNQFACRICMQLAESEIGYFLSEGNNEPARFSQKGQALLNYYLGRKEENILFRSGNLQSRNGFREREEMQSLIADLRNKATDENLLPGDRYIYDGDTPAEMNLSDLDRNEGLMLGMKNNMMGDPFYVKQRQLMGGILIVGANVEKNRSILETISRQLESLVGEHCPIYSAESYLDRDSDVPFTLLQFEESDPSMEEALEEWLDVREQQRVDGQQDLSRQPSHQFQAPAGMESEFAELMGSLNMNAMTSQAATPRRSSRLRRELPLVVSVPHVEDVKMMNSLSDEFGHFRTKIYTDSNSCNHFAMGESVGQLSASQVVVEPSQGVFRKIRLVNIR